MRMFRKGRYPQDTDIMQTNGYPDAMANMPLENEKAEAGKLNDNIKAPDNMVNMPYTKPNPKTGLSGAARVLITAKRLFPDAPYDVALDLMMDEFENKKAQPAMGMRDTKETQNVLMSLYEDEGKIKKIIPGFSVAKALENEEFKRLVLNEGMDLFSAYEKINAIRKAENGGLIDEVGDSAYASTPGSADYDITSLSEEDFNRYIKKILDDEE